MTKAMRGRFLWVGLAVVVLGVVVAALFAVTRDDGGGAAGSSSPPAPKVRTGFVLDRADPAVGGADAVVAFDVATGETSVAYSADRIVSFAASAGTLVVVTGAQEAHVVTMVDVATGDARQIALPGPGSVDLLASEGERSAFLFTSAGDPQNREFSNALLWLDGDQNAAMVVERDGVPLEAADWLWLPGGREVLVIDTHEELLRFAPEAPENAEDLGHWEGLESVSADGAAAIVRDHHDTVELSLGDGAGMPFGPTPIDGAAPFGGDVAFLVDGPERVQKVALPLGDEGRVSSAVVVDDGASPRVLYRATEQEGIDGFEVSPDGRFVAIEVVPDVAAMASDAYFPHARAVSIVTRVVSVADGEVVAEFPGFGAQWGASAG